MFNAINELAVFVAATLSVAVGSIWYSPLLFGNQWIKAARLTLEEENLSSREAWLITIQGVLIQCVFFFCVAYALTFAEGRSFLGSGAFIGLLLLSYLMGVVVWERKSLMYFYVNAGYGLIALFGGMAIITYWPW